MLPMSLKSVTKNVIIRIGLPAIALLVVAGIVCVPMFSVRPSIASALNITSVTTDRGPTTGGTMITLHGDFAVQNFKVVQIGAGEHHICALGSNGQVYCWGPNFAGQLGDGSTNQSDVPVAVDTSGVLAGKTLVKIGVGSEHVCALDSVGEVYCWGDNTYGQLGNGSSVAYSSTPVKVYSFGVLAGKTPVDISSGTRHTCVIDSGGKAYCWGEGQHGELGDGGTSDSSVPVAVVDSGALNGAVLTQIAPALYHTCALDSTHQLYCWGSNASGVFGDGSTTGSLTPVAISNIGDLTGKTISQISADYYNTCVIDTAGKAYCWGENWSGQLGNGSYGSSLTPVAVNTAGALFGKTLVQINVRENTTCAVDSDGRTYCWGDNYHGEIGDGSINDDSPFPVAIGAVGALAGKNIVQVAVGSFTVCAVDFDGWVYCWGSALGNGSTDSRTPVAVHTVSNGTGSDLSDSGDYPFTVILDTNGTPAVCTGVAIASDGKSLTCTTSAHPAGVVGVTVDDSVNRFTLPNSFEYFDIKAPDTGYKHQD